MDLETLLTEAAPARRVSIDGPGSPAAERLYQRITSQAPGKAPARRRYMARGITGLAIAGVAAIVDWVGPAVHGPVTKLPRQARSSGHNRKRALLASAAVVLVAAGGYGVSKALDTPGGGSAASPSATSAALISTSCSGLKATGGTLSSVSGTSLVIKTAGGKSVTVTTSPSTEVIREVTGSTRDITDGAQVTVHGSTSGGTIDATLVAITPGKAPSLPKPKLPSGLGNGSLRLGFASGTIANASGSGFTVDEPGGLHVKVSVSSSASIVAMVNSSLSQLQTGKLTSAVGNPGSNGTLAATTIEQDALAAKPALPHNLPSALPSLRHSLPSGLPTKLPGPGNGHPTSLPKPPSASKIGSLFSGLGCSQRAIATTDLVTMAGSQRETVRRPGSGKRAWPPHDLARNHRCQENKIRSGPQGCPGPNTAPTNAGDPCPPRLASVTPLADRGQPVFAMIPGVIRAQHTFDSIPVARRRQQRVTHRV